MKYGVHQTMINAWKKQTVEGMADVFSGKSEALEAARDGEVEKLYAMIEPHHPRLAIRRQCELVGVSRSTSY